MTKLTIAALKNSIPARTSQPTVDLADMTFAALRAGATGPGLTQAQWSIAIALDTIRASIATTSVSQGFFARFTLSARQWAAQGMGRGVVLSAVVLAGFALMVVAL